MSEMSQESLINEPLKTCVVCGGQGQKDDMYYVSIEEPGASDWVCEECYERGRDP